MTASARSGSAGTDRERDLERRLAEAQGTIEALLSGQIDAVVDSRSQTPVLLYRAQQALRESEAQYRQIVEATSDGILKMDEDARIVFANGRLEQMLGYAPRELTGVAFSSLLGGEASKAPPASLTEWPTEGVDVAVVRKDAREITARIAMTCINDDRGQRLGYLGVLRDDPEKRKRQSERLFRDRVASVGTLAGGVAHEINNPLAAVIANLEFVLATLPAALPDEGPPPGASLGEPPLLQQIRAALGDARAAAERIRRIVGELKALTRSPERESTHSVDVEATLESALQMVSKELRNRARIARRFAGVPCVMANPARLIHVFINLLVNAAQALPEGQLERNEVAVSTRLEAGRVIIEIHDTGPGIPREILHRIFDAFFTTKPVGVGTGLGLAVSQQLVDEMGGDLMVESEPGAGATFRVALPALVR